MDVKHIRDVKLVSEGTLSFLAQDELRNNIPMGILDRLRNNSRTFDSYHLFVVEQAGQVGFYAHLTPPFPLCLSVGAPAAVVALVQYLKTISLLLHEVQGPLSVVQTFLAAWPELAAHKYHEDRQGLFRLTEVTMPPATGASWEVAQIEDLETYAQWACHFSAETGDTSQSLEESLHGQRQRIGARDLYCMRLDKKPVAMATAGRRLPHGRTIGLVYTPPEHRGKGYASELVARLSAHLLASGNEFCALFTQLSNPTSNKIYQRMGYEWVDEFCMCKFRSPWPDQVKFP